MHSPSGRLLTRIPLGMQYFLWMAFSIALLLSLMVAQNYRSTFRALENEYIGHATQIVKKNNSLLDAHYDAALSALLQLTARAEEFLAMSEQERGKAIRALEGSNAALLTTAFIVTPLDEVITARQTLFRILGDAPLLRLVKGVREGGLGITVSPPYYSLLSGATAAVLYPFRTRDGLSVAALELNLEGIKSLTDPYVIGDSQSYLIMNRENGVVFFGQATGMLPTVPYTPFPRVDSAFVAEVAAAASPVATIRHGGRRYLCIQSGYNRFGWRTVALIDEALFFQSRTETLTANLWLMAVFLALLLVNAWLLSRRFSSPIYDLVRQVNAVTDVERGDVFIVTHRQDAIGKLTESYNNLILRIRQLIVDIKQSEKQKQQYAFRMLQHQISPHFLYNTLLCISHLARQGNSEQVDRTIRSLASLLGYSMGAPDALVKLKEEISTVEKYMLIQNTRFGDAFALQTEVPEGVGERLVPKLILQPLVENAITHGLAPKNALYGRSANDRIAIRAETGDGRLRVIVDDNGMGMSEAQLSQLRAGVKARETGAEGEHIGLRNVAQRIRLYFGEEATFDIESHENAGTRITIAVPDRRP